MNFVKNGVFSLAKYRGITSTQLKRVVQELPPTIPEVVRIEMGDIEPSHTAECIRLFPLERFPNLSELDLLKVQLNEEAFDLLNLEEIPELAKLSVQSVKGTSISKLNLASVKKLRSLFVSGQIGYDGFRALRLDDVAPHLEELYLCYNVRDEEELHEFRLGDKPELKLLYLPGNNIGNTGASQFPFGSTPNLETLCLSRNRIQSDGAGLLQLESVPKLKQLYFCDNWLGPEGAKQLRLDAVPLLQVLDLSGNGLGNDGASSLRLHNSKSLSKIYLSGNGIGEPGARSLARQDLPSLTELIISSSSSFTGDVDAGFDIIKAPKES